MAITLDQATLGSSGIDSTATTIPLTTTQAVAAGALIVIPVGWGDPAQTLTSVTGGGLTWTIDKQGNATNGSAGCGAIVSAQAPAGLASGTVLTANYSGTVVGRAICGFSLLGCPTSSPVDTTSGHTDYTGTTAWTTASTTIAAGSILIGSSHCTTTNDTSTPTSPSLELFDFGGGAGTFGQTVCYRIQASGGGFTVAGTWSGSEQGTVIAVAYKAAAVSATATIGWIGAAG